MNLNINRQVKYWINESMEALDTAKVLFNAGKNLESAFFCNLACEKILKAVFVKKTSQIPPRIHSLKQLAKLSTLYDNMSENQREFLDTLEVFQIESRYPRDRKKIYQTTPISVFEQLLINTEEMIKWIQKSLI